MIVIAHRIEADGMELVYDTDDVARINSNTQYSHDDEHYRGMLPSSNRLTVSITFRRGKGPRWRKIEKEDQPNG